MSNEVHDQAVELDEESLAKVCGAVAEIEGWGDEERQRFEAQVRQLAETAPLHCALDEIERSRAARLARD